MNLKQRSIDEALLEAGKKIALIEANTGLLAEAESLSAALRATFTEALYKNNGQPVVSCTYASIRVWVQFSLIRRSAVVDAIERAGLKIAGETLEPAYPGESTIHIEGLQVGVYIASPAEELAEAV